MVRIEAKNKTAPEEVESRHIKGVVAVILSQDGKILVVQETEGKPQLDKKAGDWSMPAETIEEGETELEALLRLIEEEIGENGDINCGPGNDWIGDYQFGKNSDVWGRAYLLHFNGTSETPRTFIAEGGEVINHSWINPAEIRDMPRRRGILEIIEDFIDEKRGVVRQECLSGFRQNP